MRHLFFAFGAIVFACGDVEKTNSAAEKPSFEEIKEATKTPEKPALAVKTEAPPKGDGPLYNPESVKKTAPDDFTVLVDTTKGDFLVEIHRDWAPNGADQF